MSKANQECINLLIQESISDKNADQLFEIIFDKDLQVDTKKLLAFLYDIADSLEGELTQKTDTKNYVKVLEDTDDELDYFLLKLRDALISPESKAAFSKLDYTLFWNMFAIAEKKCIGAPYSSIDDEASFFSQVIVDTSEQKKAHKECINGFNMDSDRFSRATDPMLKLFLHPFHSKNKKLRTKKKNIHRVLKTTKRVMQAYKISHRHDSYNIFVGKCYVVPDDFTKYVVKTYLGE